MYLLISHLHEHASEVVRGESKGVIHPVLNTDLKISRPRFPPLNCAIHSNTEDLGSVERQEPELVSGSLQCACASSKVKLRVISLCFPGLFKYILTILYIISLRYEELNLAGGIVHKCTR